MGLPDGHVGRIDFERGNGDRFLRIGRAACDQPRQGRMADQVRDTSCSNSLIQ